ncbi:uncharacterized protein At4g06744-like [Salvia miltiorrhiza]|uniref:uncharacterized protein At4g06744-like n=1 Tax=Salvia miltiorrhiza TaxID=226208 RepID=UPI0025AD0FBC|nr:uncharacterized protein At4g06744-like [Salvia miltiorrhiza]
MHPTKTAIKIQIIIAAILLGVARHGETHGLTFPSAPPLGPTPSEADLIFTDQRLAAVFPIIQNFKSLITSDPFNVTATWAGPDVCAYKGFYCESPPDNRSATALASIDFNGFRLAAPTLAGFLDRLPDLALFHANSNDFGGAIPPGTAALPYLYELDVSNNRLSGPFPAAVVGMAGLAFLDLRFNALSGAVPPQLFGRRGLDALFINNNLFATRLPDNLGATHIVYLTLANNRFFGPIPRSISRTFSNVSEILLLNNLLSGCLPYELGFLTEAAVIDAGGNRLTGPLPPSLGCLQSLEALNLAGNLLYGQVPEALCWLGKVANLSLSENYFTGVGPACWRLISNGVLDVRRNCIPGFTSQRSVAECAAFFARPPRFCPYMPVYGRIPCRLPPRYAADLPQLAPSPE